MPLLLEFIFSVVQAVKKRNIFVDEFVAVFFSSLWVFVKFWLYKKEASQVFYIKGVF